MKPRIAYFTMELGLKSSIPTYSGGLGILAGDTLKSAADMGVPMIGVTLLHNNGYFTQKIVNGWQVESFNPFDPKTEMKELPDRIKVSIDNEDTSIRAWLYEIKGQDGYKIPVIFLDTNGVNGRQWPADGSTGESGVDRTWRDDITGTLYGGDEDYRLKQEIVLGIGGVKMLQKLGYDNIETYHMNEGHPALLALELLLQHHGNPDDVRKKNVFTTHTPVPAGHDRFPDDLVDRLLPQDYATLYKKHAREPGIDYQVNNTVLALNLSRYANAVSLRYGEISKGMFPGYNIDTITNGVHPYTWTSEYMQNVFDKLVPEWRTNPSRLSKLIYVPNAIEEIKKAHFAAKKRLLIEVNKITGESFDPNLLTIGFARRATEYKRGDLLLRNSEMLRKIGAGKIQLIYAGKAHPKDDGGKRIIHEIHEYLKKLGGSMKGVYMPDYNLDQGALLTSGVDLWLNHPLKPQEASGTSGMKAALNGVPSLSVLDGWWLEGHIKNSTGWAIGNNEPYSDLDKEVMSALSKLKYIIKIFPTEKWDQAMLGSIAFNGSHFNTHRMLQEYVDKAYRPGTEQRNLEELVAPQYAELGA